MSRYQAYVEYKDSGVEWLGDVPSHWQLKRIKESAVVINGYPFDSKKFDPTNGTPLVRIRDIFSKTAEVKFDGLVPTEALINNGDILIGMDGDFNVAWWDGGEAALNQRVACIRTELKSLTRFIYYIMPFSMKVVNDLTYFTTVKHLSSFDIIKTRFAMPPENELIKIANFLDHETAKIDLLIEKQQGLIALLKEKRQAVISHAVTKGLNPNAPMKDSGVEWLGEVPGHWDVKQLKHIVRAGTIITYGIVQAGPHYDGGVPYIKTSDMSGEELPIDGYALTSPEIDASYSRSKVTEGDLVIGIRASIGKCLPVPPGLSGANLTQGTARIAPGEGVNKVFLLWFLRSSVTQAYFDSMAKGATFREITLDALRRTPALMPNIEEQIKISSYIEEKTNVFNKLQSNAELAVTMLKERRTALISAAVTGKIDVRDWQA